MEELSLVIEGLSPLSEVDEKIDSNPLRKWFSLLFPATEDESIENGPDENVETDEVATSNKAELLTHEEESDELPTEENDPYYAVFETPVKSPYEIDRMVEEGMPLEDAQRDYIDYLHNEIDQLLEKTRSHIALLEHYIESGELEATAEVRAFIDELKTLETRLAEARGMLRYYDFDAEEIRYNVCVRDIDGDGIKDWEVRSIPASREALISESYWRITGRTTIQVPDMPKDVMGKVAAAAA